MKKIYFVLKLVVVLVMAGVGWWFYPLLPATVPTHWNYAGVPDAFGPKETMIWLFPVITLAMLLLFWLLPKLDPKKEKYKLFATAYEMIQLSIVGFFGYMYVVTLYASLNPAVNVGAWVVGGIGVLFILIGNFLSKVRQNYFVGVKTPWTLNSEEVWNKTHRLAAWCFVIGGLIFLVMALTGKIWLEIFILAMVVAGLLPVVYSYVISKR